MTTCASFATNALDMALASRRECEGGGVGHPDEVGTAPPRGTPSASRGPASSPVRGIPARRSTTAWPKVWSST